MSRIDELALRNAADLAVVYAKAGLSHASYFAANAANHAFALHPELREETNSAKPTQHSESCKMAFGRKDLNCPRCRELMSGSPARQWSGSRRADNDRRRCAEIREHFRSHKHLSGGCGVVCTFGEW
jgi:hypothetical protein